jgi:hypothetical protein
LCLLRCFRCEYFGNQFVVQMCVTFAAMSLYVSTLFGWVLMQSPLYVYMQTLLEKTSDEDDKQSLLQSHAMLTLRKSEIEKQLTTKGNLKRKPGQVAYMLSCSFKFY